MNITYRKNEDIWQEAEKFRQKYCDPDKPIPVPIIEIAEIKLKLNPYPVPGLKELVDVIGYLSKDLTTIVIDQKIYEEDRFLNLLRFTYAHEIGHLVLHADIIRNSEFRNAEVWKKYRLDMPEDEIAKFEYQANEFAGRLMVPKEELMKAVSIYSSQIKDFFEKSNNENSDLICDFLGRVVCIKFMVSSDVIAIRIKREDIIKQILA